MGPQCRKKLKELPATEEEMKIGIVVDEKCLKNIKKELIDEGE